MRKESLCILWRTERATLVLVSGIASSVGCIVGLAGSVVVLKQRLEKQSAQIIEDEVESIKKYYNRLHKKNEFATPMMVVDVLEDEIGVKAVPRPDDIRANSTTRNMFHGTHVTSLFDYQQNEQNKLDGRAYIIDYDEFMSSEVQNTTLTYFEGDNVLSDQHDEPLMDLDEVVGEDNLLCFGQGSNDNNIVYIRNDKLDINFEVIRSQGKYAQEVLGFIEHSEKRKPRKFRRDRHERAD